MGISLIFIEIFLTLYFDKAAEGNYAFMNSESGLKYYLKNRNWKIFIKPRYRISSQHTNQFDESQFHMAKECFMSFRVGLSMPKHSPYRDRAHQIIEDLLAGGFVDRWMEEINEKAIIYNRKVSFSDGGIF